MARLTPKQQKFADEYVATGNATEAAIKAGYSKNYANTNASKLLQNTTIKQRVEKRMAEIADAKIMKAKEAMERLTEIARGERKEEVVLMSPRGDVITIEKAPDNATVIRAIQEILKRYPTAKQAEKMQAEIDVLKAKVDGNGEGDERLTALFDKLEDSLGGGG